MTAGGMEKNIASLTFNLSVNEMDLATPGTVVVDGCNTNKMYISLGQYHQGNGASSFPPYWLRTCIIPQPSASG